MKSKLLLIFSITALLITSGFAQPMRHGPNQGPPPGGPGGPRGQGGPGGGPALADYLQLTADQKTQWETLHKDFATASQALFDKEAAIHQQIDTALRSGSTDATAIGTLMLSARDVRNQIKTAHDALETKLQALLTADQKAKYAAFEAAVAFVGQRRPR